MGLCASAIEQNPHQVVPVHHHSEEERQKKIAAAEEDESEHCIGCIKSFPKDELKLSPCCGHELCKDCLPQDGRELCAACTHNVKAGAELAKVKPREDTRGMVDDSTEPEGSEGGTGLLAHGLLQDGLSESDFRGTSDQRIGIFGEQCPVCQDRCNSNAFKVPKCCSRNMCAACAIGADVEDGKCKMCEKEALEHDESI
jgi:hypothetical protein